MNFARENPQCDMINVTTQGERVIREALIIN